MKFLAGIFLLFFSTILLSQQPATTSQDVLKAIQQKEGLQNNSLVKNLPFKNIGPTIMSGRVVDIAVNPDNPTEFYVGYASGGVWYTNNNGTSFTPILDNSPTQNVGALAVNWQKNIIWVGTGEVNASRSSYAGIGLLQSNDKGKTWNNLGLADTHHISRILINPNNSNEIIVGAIGPLYSNSQARGIFKSTDGGKTWNKTLFVDEKTGVIEIAVDPNNFNIQFASTWEKDRKAWNFSGSGSGSAIYKSLDAGNTWQKITTPQSGFPTGDGVGRIGLAVVDQNVIYAIHDNQFLRPSEKQTKNDDLTKDQFKQIDKEDFLKLNDDKLEKYLRDNQFQEKYTAASVKKMVKEGSVNPLDLAKYLEDANSLLFDTPVVGAEVYKSEDGGKTWGKTHEGFLDGIYYSYGYYFGKIHVDPSNKEAIYIYGVPILKSKDGGKTFTSIDADNVHADHHVLWINPKKPGHLINGNDGGINISYDDGAHWIKCNTPAVGQFYAINVDNQKPYNVYGGLQDNGVWVGSSTNQENVSWHQSGKYPFEMIMGGDGMQIQIDQRDPNIVYTGFQFGNYFRLNRATNQNKYIQPKHELGDNPYRFNWQTPILLSIHNQDILYYGGNKLLRSFNKGDDWEAISQDLTNGGKKGNVAYGTLTTISESAFQFGLIYTGSDDGLVYVTKNGGATWEDISQGLPKDLWVSRVIASKYKKPRVYVTLNGYRWDNFNPYIYVSEDFGKSWKSINANIPASPINVIKEDSENENILYIGTDNGAYVTFNRGQSWEPFVQGLPAVAVHDIVVQPEAKEIVLGTHGRSIYVADVSLLQQIGETNQNSLLLNEIKQIKYSNRWGASFNNWDTPYEPTLEVQFYSPQTGNGVVTITNQEGNVLQSFNQEAVKGINTIKYDLTVNEKAIKGLEKKDINISKAQNGKYYLTKGTYILEVTVEGKKANKKFEIK